MHGAEHKGGILHSNYWQRTYNNKNSQINRTQYSSCHVNLSASGIYFGSPFGRYPMFHTLTSVGRKQYFQYVKRMFPLFRAIVKFTDYMSRIS